MSLVLYEPVDGAIITSVQTTHFQKMISVGDCMVRLNDCKIKNSQDIYKCLEKINPKNNNLKNQKLEDYGIETKFSPTVILDSQKMKQLNSEDKGGINSVDGYEENILKNTKNKKTVISKQQDPKEIKKGGGGDDFLIITLDSGKQLKVYVLDEEKLRSTENIVTSIDTSESLSQLVELHDFSKFQNVNEAVESTQKLIQSELSDKLMNFLQDSVVNKKLKDSLAICDLKLGSKIQDKLGIKCIYDKQLQQLMKTIRSQITSIVGDVSPNEMRTMSRGLSHSLSRHKLKFSPEKVDTMVVQAISLLSDMEKELNIYSMRVKEWYGWHFPELVDLIDDHILYSRIVNFVGVRNNIPKLDLKEFFQNLDTYEEGNEEDVNDTIEQIRSVAKVSMGTEISEDDIMNIQYLASQVVSMAEGRQQLLDYLKNRMTAIAPNLTSLVGEIVGAKLIAKAGSLISLAKHPASTIQILGAEKALFRALKTDHDTPKYGLIYHASLVGQATPKNRGRISRILAAKCALAIRVDSLGEDPDNSLGIRVREIVERKVRQFEERGDYHTNRKVRNSQGGFRNQNIDEEMRNKFKSAYNEENDFDMRRNNSKRDYQNRNNYNDDENNFKKRRFNNRK
ncbi:nucleolar protein [Anaeramoeba flamelloides]|uniref:Nucleolar protein n=1 Tax=Anaeramoeba flamelloides TaxID=1746091 RepID=A0ABQ8XY25_9EUKA|nr:nucleolar protein [Anaeramoeba flamelloides]